MSNRRLVVMNIRELLRLKQLGQTEVEIARLLGCHRMTVAKYRRWAEGEGLLGAPLPDEAALHARLASSMPAALAHQESSSLTRFTEEIKEFRARGVRMRAICRRLEERHGIVVGYEALRRVVRRLEPASPEVFVRVETRPGNEAQVDFGYAGRTLDRVHGTTRRKPYQVWKDEEIKWLGVLPKDPFDLPTYKSAGLGRDCHLQFEQSYYSAPFRLVGSQLLVRAGLSDLRIYLPDNHELVATHARARAAGERHTHPDHLPAEKLPGLTLNRADCLSQATGIGPATRQVVAGLLDHRPEDYLCMAGQLLKLAKKVGPDRLEQACARSLLFDEPEYQTVRRILDKGLEGQAVLDVPQPTPKGQILRFARPATEYALTSPQAGGAP